MISFTSSSHSHVNEAGITNANGPAAVAANHRARADTYLSSARRRARVTSMLVTQAESPTLHPLAVCSSTAPASHRQRRLSQHYPAPQVPAVGLNAALAQPQTSSADEDTSADVNMNIASTVSTRPTCQPADISETVPNSTGPVPQSAVSAAASTRAGGAQLFNAPGAAPRRRFRWHHALEAGDSADASREGSNYGASNAVRHLPADRSSTASTQPAKRPGSTAVNHAAGLDTVPESQGLTTQHSSTGSREVPADPRVSDAVRTSGPDRVSGSKAGDNPSKPTIDRCSGGPSPPALTSQAPSDPAKGRPLQSCPNNPYVPQIEAMAASPKQQSQARDDPHLSRRRQRSPNPKPQPQQPRHGKPLTRGSAGSERSAAATKKRAGKPLHPAKITAALAASKSMDELLARLADFGALGTRLRLGAKGDPSYCDHAGGNASDPAAVPPASGGAGPEPGVAPLNAAQLCAALTAAERLASQGEGGVKSTIGETSSAAPSAGSPCPGGPAAATSSGNNSSISGPGVPGTATSADQQQQQQWRQAQEQVRRVRVRGLLSPACRPLTRREAGALEGLLSAHREVLADAGPWEMAATLWAAARLRLKPPPEALAPALEAFWMWDPADPTVNRQGALDPGVADRPGVATPGSGAGGRGGRGGGGASDAEPDSSVRGAAGGEPQPGDVMSLWDVSLVLYAVSVMWPDYLRVNAGGFLEALDSYETAPAAAAAGRTAGPCLVPEQVVGVVMALSRAEARLDEVGQEFVLQAVASRLASFTVPQLTALLSAAQTWPPLAAAMHGALLAALLRRLEGDELRQRRQRWAQRQLLQQLRACDKARRVVAWAARRQKQLLKAGKALPGRRSRWLALRHQRHGDAGGRRPVIGPRPQLPPSAAAETRARGGGAAAGDLVNPTRNRSSTSTPSDAASSLPWSPTGDPSAAISSPISAAAAAATEASGGAAPPPVVPTESDLVRAMAENARAILPGPVVARALSTALRSCLDPRTGGLRRGYARLMSRLLRLVRHRSAALGARDVCEALRLMAALRAHRQSVAAWNEGLRVLLRRWGDVLGELLGEPGLSWGSAEARREEGKVPAAVVVFQRKSMHEEARADLLLSSSARTFATSLHAVSRLGVRLGPEQSGRVAAAAAALAPHMRNLADCCMVLTAMSDGVVGPELQEAGGNDAAGPHHPASGEAERQGSGAAGSRRTQVPSERVQQQQIGSASAMVAAGHPGFVTGKHGKGKVAVRSDAVCAEAGTAVATDTDADGADWRWVGGGGVVPLGPEGRRAARLVLEQAAAHLQLALGDPGPSSGASAGGSGPSAGAPSHGPGSRAAGRQDLSSDTAAAASATGRPGRRAAPGEVVCLVRAVGRLGSAPSREWWAAWEASAWLALPPALRVLSRWGAPDGSPPAPSALAQAPALPGQLPSQGVEAPQQQELQHHHYSKSSQPLRRRGQWAPPISSPSAVPAGGWLGTGAARVPLPPFRPEEVFTAAEAAEVLSGLARSVQVQGRLQRALLRWQGRGVSRRSASSPAGTRVGRSQRLLVSGLKRQHNGGNRSPSRPQGEGQELPVSKRRARTASREGPTAGAGVGGIAGGAAGANASGHRVAASGGTAPCVLDRGLLLQLLTVACLAPPRSPVLWGHSAGAATARAASGGTNTRAGVGPPAGVSHSVRAGAGGMNTSASRAPGTGGGSPGATRRDRYRGPGPISTLNLARAVLTLRLLEPREVSLWAAALAAAAPAAMPLLTPRKQVILMRCVVRLYGAAGLPVPQAVAEAWLAAFGANMGRAMAPTLAYAAAVAAEARLAPPPGWLAGLRAAVVRQARHLRLRDMSALVFGLLLNRRPGVELTGAAAAVTPIGLPAAQLGGVSTTDRWQQAGLVGGTGAPSPQHSGNARLPVMRSSREFSRMPGVEDPRLESMRRPQRLFEEEGNVELARVLLRVLKQRRTDSAAAAPGLTTDPPRQREGCPGREPAVRSTKMSPGDKALARNLCLVLARVVALPGEPAGGQRVGGQPALKSSGAAGAAVGRAQRPHPAREAVQLHLAALDELPPNGGAGDRQQGLLESWAAELEGTGTETRAQSSSRAVALAPRPLLSLRRTPWDGNGRLVLHRPPQQ